LWIIVSRIAVIEAISVSKSEYTNRAKDEHRWNQQDQDAASQGLDGARLSGRGAVVAHGTALR
jgi:hypothetical protein